MTNSSRGALKQGIKSHSMWSKKKAAKAAKKQKQQAAADAKQAKKDAAAEAAAQKREPVMGFPFNGGATTTSLRRASGYAPVNGYAYLEAGRNSVVDAPV